MYDALIVGGGPAGLSAALSLAHFRRSVLLLDAGEQRNLPSHAIHNYLGLDGLAPRELLARGRAEAQQAGAELLEARVTHIQQHASGFAVELDGQPAASSWPPAWSMSSRTLSTSRPSLGRASSIAPCAMP